MANISLIFHCQSYSVFTFTQEAEKAIKGLNGKLALSKPLVIDWAKEYQARSTEVSADRTAYMYLDN